MTSRMKLQLLLTISLCASSPLDLNKIESGFEIQAPCLVRVRDQSVFLSLAGSLLGLGKGWSALSDTPVLLWAGHPDSDPLRQEDLGQVHTRAPKVTGHSCQPSPTQTFPSLVLSPQAAELVQDWECLHLRKLSTCPCQALLVELLFSSTLKDTQLPDAPLPALPLGHTPLTVRPKHPTQRFEQVSKDQRTLFSVSDSCKGG